MTQASIEAVGESTTCRDGIDNDCDCMYDCQDTDYMDGGTCCASALCENTPECRGCFVAGTSITMADGTQRPIETITVGETVLTYDPVSGQIRTGEVTETFIHFDKNNLMLINGTLEATVNHRFYVDGRWIPADQLKIGDQVLVWQGGSNIAEQTLQPTSIHSLTLMPDRKTVYNIEVSGDHNYFANGILAHNKDVPSIQAQEVVQNGSVPSIILGRMVAGAGFEPATFGL